MSYNDNQGNSWQGSKTQNWQNKDGGDRGNYQNKDGSEKGGYQNKGNYQKRNNFYKKQEEDDSEPRLYKAYVGTGNRDAPQGVLDDMKRLASELEGFGYMLRTGGMDGPEAAFEDGAKELELHLPWRGFNDKQSKFTFTSNQAKGIAAMFHTSFDALKPVIQTFLAKNVRLLLGKDLKSPAMFAIIWSEDGAETLKEKSSKTGSAGHVIAIASAMKIPVYNIQRSDAETRLKTYLGLLSDEQNQQTKPSIDTLF